MLLILILNSSSYNSIGSGVDGGDQEQRVAVVPGAGDQVLKGCADPLLLDDVPHLLGPVVAPVGLVADAADPLADVAEVADPVALVDGHGAVVLLCLLPRGVVAGRNVPVGRGDRLVGRHARVLVARVVHEAQRLGLEAVERTPPQLVQAVEVALEDGVLLLYAARPVHKLLRDVAPREEPPSPGRC